MNKIRHGIVAFALVLTSVSLLHSQDLSRYRNFSLGMSVASVSKLTDQQPDQAQVIHQQPALIQELTWYPPLPYDSSRQAEPVDTVVFSFYNGALYRILVTYESPAVQGLKDEDMIGVLSATYGVATRPVAEVNFPTSPSYRATEKVIARWEDSQYSLNLFRPSDANTFAIVMFDKSLDAQAGVSIAESVRLEQQGAPQRAADQVKKQADDLEQERQKNIKALRP